MIADVLLLVMALTGPVIGWAMACRAARITREGARDEANH